MPTSRCCVISANPLAFLTEVASTGPDMLFQKHRPLVRGEAADRAAGAYVGPSRVSFQDHVSKGSGACVS